jgi:DNA-binding NarL/FixJ family response regulator
VIRILVADDQLLVRAGFRSLLDGEDDIEDADCMGRDRGPRRLLRPPLAPVAASGWKS